MATTTMRVVIDASAQGALAAIKAVGGAVGDLSDTSRRSGQVTEGAFKTIGKVAGVATKTVAVGWTAAAAVVGKTAVSAFKTGVEFNTLQQRAYASFETILGSGAAAEQMMTDIQRFADTSPFPRQAFIDATQQMLAFGIEADKVVPILGAVQDAVAAAGGSAADIGEITYILSQVQSSGRITGTTLMQLGKRGIDAAALIGDSMGKSADVIRSDITSGALDADTAIAALTDGMTRNFGGAAQNVKKTWIGTTDSVRAAIRDIGAAMAEPFVAARGGGLFVEWGNDVADILRSVRDIVREIMPQLVADFGGSLGAVGDILAVAKDALAGFDLSTAAEQFHRFAPVLGMLTGAFAAMAGGLGKHLPVIGKLLGGLSGPVGILALGIGGLVATSPDLQAAFGSTVRDVFDALRPGVEAITDALMTLTPILSDLITAALPLVPAFADIAGTVLATLIPPLVTVAQALAPVLVTVLGGVASALGAVASNRAVVGVIAGLATGFLLLNKAVGLVKAVMLIWKGQLITTKVGLAALKVQTLAQTAAAKIAAAGQWLLNAAMSANPIMLVVLAVAALVAGFILLWNKSEGFRNFFIAMWGAIKAAALAVWDAIKVGAQAVWDFLRAAFEAVGAVAASVWGAIRTAAEAVWNAILTVAGIVFAAVRAYLQAWLTIARTVFNGVRTVATTVFNAVRAVVQTVIGAVTSIVRTVQTVASSVFGAVRSTVSTVFGAVRSTVSGVIDTVKAIIRTVRDVASSVFGAVRDTARTMFNQVRDIVRGVIDAVKKIIKGVQDVASTVFGAARGFAESAFNAMLAPVRAVKDAVDAVFSAVGNVIGAIGRIKFPSPPGWLKDLFSVPVEPEVDGVAALARYEHVNHNPRTTLADALANLTAAALSGGGGGLLSGTTTFVNIEVNGALDPVAVSRQIETLLTRRARRNGGVRIDAAGGRVVNR